MSIWSTFLSLDDTGDDRQPIAYHGSHLWPNPDDRGGRVDLALMGGHLTPDAADTGDDDGAPWPWLRLSVGDTDGGSGAVLLDRELAEILRDGINRWLQPTAAAGAAPTGGSPGDKDGARWTAPPPGSTREQLPADLLALLPFCPTGPTCPPPARPRAAWARPRSAAPTGQTNSNSGATACTSGAVSTTSSPAHPARADATAKADRRARPQGAAGR